jgi:regulator of RNase E activity RraA
MLDAWRGAASSLSTALVLDCLDSAGLPRQAPRLAMPPRTSASLAIGRAKCLQWADFAHVDPDTYELELKAIDSVAAGDIIVCAASGSVRSGIWGELLTTAAMARGATGIVTDGAVRDQVRMDAMGFAVFSAGVSPYDSLNRQKVIAYDVPVELDGVVIAPGDILIADPDGVAVVPAQLADKILAAAIAKATKEDGFRDAVRAGASLTEAYARFQIL